MEGTEGTVFVSIEEEEIENITMVCIREVEAKTTQTLKAGN